MWRGARRRCRPCRIRSQKNPVNLGFAISAGKPGAPGAFSSGRPSENPKKSASDVLKKCAEWYPQHSPGFEDFCDPAGQQQKSIESDKNERRDVEVLAGLGIHPRYEYGWGKKDGRTLIHQLLALRTDNTPSVYVDPAGCPWTMQAFLGRYVYPETRDGKLSEDPNDDEHPFSDVMAALRYLVVGLHHKLALTRFKASSLEPPKAPAHTGYGSVPRRAGRA